MELLARRITERNGDYAEITGGRDIGRILRIPDEIEGLPVCSVAGHAFERNQMIEEVILPDSLLQVGGFAFYGCGRLRKISLSDHTEGWGNGVLRLCDSLSHVEFRVLRERYGILRDLLAGTDCRLYVKIVRDTEETELYFPAYVRGFDERAGHPLVDRGGGLRIQGGRRAEGREHEDLRFAVCPGAQRGHGEQRTGRALEAHVS